MAGNLEVIKEILLGEPLQLSRCIYPGCTVDTNARYKFDFSDKWHAACCRNHLSATLVKAIESGEVMENLDG